MAGPNPVVGNNGQKPISVMYESEPEELPSSKQQQEARHSAPQHQAAQQSQPQNLYYESKSGQQYPHEAYQSTAPQSQESTRQDNFKPPKHPTALKTAHAEALGRKGVSGRKSGPTVGTQLLVAFLAVQSLLLPAYYLRSDTVRAPDFFRDYGVVGNVTQLLSQQSASGLLSLPLAFALRNMVKGNLQSQHQAASQGALETAHSLLALQRSPLRQREGLRLLQDLLKGNTAVKGLVLKQGFEEPLLNALRQDSDEKTSAKVAEVIAVLAADNSSSRKKRLSSSGLVNELVSFLEGGHNWRSDSAVKSTWAIANLLADAPTVQTLVLQLVLPKTLRNLVQQDLTERIVQPTIFTIGNLAAKHTEGQDALQQAGLLTALVRIINQEVEGVKTHSSQSFRSDILEHISELQRSDPSVRAALSEVGGLEELLGIMETGAKVEASKTIKDKQLVTIEEGEEEDEIASIRSAVRDLQDEADTEGGLLPEVKLSNLAIWGRSQSGARVLPRLSAKTRQQLAGDAAWALALLVADNAGNQNAAREAGALEGLVKLVEGAYDSSTAKYALTAISSLIKNNPENKAAVRDANGVQGLVKLLASNPADKDVLKATAEALKFMATDRPAYEHLARGSLRWLRVLGRQLAVVLLTVFGVTVSPTAASALVVALLSLLAASVIALLLSATKTHAYEG